jgi:hypothetical protein
MIVTIKDVCDSTALNFISRMFFRKEVCAFSLLETCFLKVIYMTSRLQQDIAERAVFQDYTILIFIVTVHRQHFTMSVTRIVGL